METIWLEISSNEMLTNDFITFVEFLSVAKMKYTSYYGYEDKIYMEVVGDMNEHFNKQLSSIMAYQPIIQLDHEPVYSDYDLIEEMSNT